MSTIRILSLDGGGTRAGILAKTLGQLYGAQTQGRDIIRQFDFIAGNSGGSIVMTALCCNYTPQDIAAFYDDPATLRRLFSPKWSAALSRVALLRTLFPPYSATGKFGIQRRCSIAIARVASRLRHRSGCTTGPGTSSTMSTFWSPRTTSTWSASRSFARTRGVLRRARPPRPISRWSTRSTYRPTRPFFTSTSRRKSVGIDIGMAGWPDTTIRCWQPSSKRWRMLPRVPRTFGC